jgi:2,3-bisphosphoglycerate-independent phosphoglycerate mutase
VRITQSIESKEVLELPTIKKAMEHSKKNDSTIHIIGLISDGGVHSHIDHIIGLNNIFKEEGHKVVVHSFMDGRDTKPKMADVFNKQLKDNEITIGSISGRYYAMDRDGNFDRTQKAYDAIVNRKGNSYTCSEEYIKEQHEKGLTDEFIEVAYNDKLDASVKEGDVIVFANFRPDRARQLAHLFVGSEVYDTPSQKIKNTYVASMMEYASIPTNIIFEPVVHKNLIGEVLEANNLTQLRAAETEKFAHVTFFMDGGKEVDFKGEEKLLIPSPKVATYDLQPEMSAIELTDKVLEKIENFDVVLMNYANPDMVGHTGIIEAAIKAVETVSEQASRIFEKVQELGGVFMLTADHGNAEQMLDENGKP